MQPAPELLAEQPGPARRNAFISAMRTPTKFQALFYSPAGIAIGAVRAELPATFDASWINPATGERSPARGETSGPLVTFTCPSTADWLLFVRAR